MTPDDVRAIVREEIEAYMARIASTALLDWSLVESDAGHAMPNLKGFLDEIAPVIGMHAQRDEGLL